MSPEVYVCKSAICLINGSKFFCLPRLLRSKDNSWELEAGYIPKIIIRELFSLFSDICSTPLKLGSDKGPDTNSILIMVFV